MLPICAKERRQNRVLAGRVISLAFVLFVAGCAVAPPPPPPGAAPVVVSPVSVIGTPFLLAFKVPVCALTLAFAAPAAAAQQLAAPNLDAPEYDIRPALDAGVVENCGPPYAVMPY